MGCRRGSLSTQGDLIVLQRAEAPVRNGGGLIETMSSAEVRLSRSSQKRIGSVDPYALKIPAPKGRNTY